jgi:quinol monooxygenase YgiN
MILVTIRARTRPDKRGEFTQTVTSLLNQIRKSPGCLSCHFYQEFAEENIFCFVEEWSSHQEFEDYLRTNTFCVLLGAMQVLLKQPSEIKINEVSQTAGQEHIEVVIGESGSGLGLP